MFTALLAVVAVAPAHAFSGVYALQAGVASGGGSLVHYAVGPGGTLTQSAPDLALSGTPLEITITPDAHFVYVATVASDGSGSIAAFDRIAANGRLVPNAVPATAAAPGAARGVIVNPQGTRVFYGQAGSIVSRPINADGSLGAAAATPIPSGATAADIRSLAMTANGRSLYASDASVTARIWQFDVDPAAGALAPKNPPVVGWPGPAGGPAVGAGRMAITPSGGHLYLATDTAGSGIGRWAIDPASGALAGGSVEAPAADGYAEAAVATSVAGDALWAPSGGGASASPERIRQFAIGAAGALTPLAPPAVDYVVAGPARDLVPSPDGLLLYLGQPGTVGEWIVGPGGTLGHRANVPPSPASGVTNAGITLSPSQAPVAAFDAGQSLAGQATSFDARASNDPDGAIARYDWAFGDGTSAPNAGPTPSHTYTSPGTRTVTLTVTDLDATSTAQLWTGTRTLRNGGPAAQTSRAVTTATVPPLQPPPPRPHKGRSVTVAAERGTILVRVPTSRRYVPIARLTEIPLGSIIDARRGRARITAEVDARTGRTQSSVFYDWFFRVLQTKGSKPITEARLVKGSFAPCTPKRRTRATSSAVSTRAAGGLRVQSAATRKKSKRKVRHLWGRGTGSFRTGGKRSAATVRGTWWLVEDRCDGTLTRVKTGRVDVRDLRLRKTIRLRAGKRSSYLAKAP
ncbi:MAG: hypothetical protein QOI64_1466 [Solirubrobacteraceae bacterium]|nr:hypothetical protein [Solirubrobacteraceae bacterium]